MTEEQKTYSIVLHLRRVTYEDAYVAVPVTGAIMIVQDDGTGRIDGEALVAAAIRIGADGRVEWKSEEMRIEAHPVQQPVPEGRFCFDAYYSKPHRASDKAVKA